MCNVDVFPHWNSDYILVSQTPTPPYPPIGYIAGHFQFQFYLFCCQFLVCKRGSLIISINEDNIFHDWKIA